MSERRQSVPVRLAALPRAHPLEWREEAPSGVFVGGATDDAFLALLGTPAHELPAAPGLPDGFTPSDAVRRWFTELLARLEQAAGGQPPAPPLPIEGVDPALRSAIEEVLGGGHGEVTGEVAFDGVRWSIREAVVPGVWRVSGDDGSDHVEVGPMASVIQRAAASLAPAPFPLPIDPPDVMNGLAVLAEISDRAASWTQRPGVDGNHVLNFTLMPLSAGDQALLTRVLGRADLSLTSGGFGRCRILATTVRHVWAVQYLNAMEHTILDTIEVGDVPAAACAAREDFEDSARRLGEILAAYGS